MKWPRTARPASRHQSPRVTRRSEAPRPSRHAMIPRKSADAMVRRIALKAGPGSSRRAAFTTLKLLPQKTAMRSSQASSREMRNRMDGVFCRAEALPHIEKKTPRRPVKAARCLNELANDRSPGRPDQPPLKLRRSAEALAKAEGLRYN